MDRRKSYVDVVERVLGNSLPSGAPSRSRRFIVQLNTGLCTVGSTVSEIYVSGLDRLDDRRGH